MSVYEETQAILNTYKIQANKSLGQNFLIDDCVIEKIIESSNIEKEDLIIEMLSGYCNRTLLTEAVELMCEYVEKKKSAIDTVMQCIKTNYSIDIQYTTIQIYCSRSYSKWYSVGNVQEILSSLSTRVMDNYESSKLSALF